MSWERQQAEIAIAEEEAEQIAEQAAIRAVQVVEETYEVEAIVNKKTRGNSIYNIWSSGQVILLIKTPEKMLSI